MKNTQSYPTTVPQMLAELQENYGYSTNDTLQSAEFLAGKTLHPWHKVTQRFRNNVLEMLVNNNAPTHM